VTKVGYVPPFAIFAATLTAIGSGLYSLFQPDTPMSQWVGFQVLTGFGRGVGFQLVLFTFHFSFIPYSTLQCPWQQIEDMLTAC
jgi:hypothetical protein